MRRKILLLAKLGTSMLLMLALLAFMGCSSSSTDSETSGSLQVASLTVSPTTVTVGTTAVVEAIVTDGSNTLSNRIIYFSVEPSTAGYFTPTFDTSDASGIGSAVFTATADGDATIRALLSTEVWRDASLSVADQVHEGSGNVDLTIIPTMILADGSSTATLNITVRDQSGNTAPDSTLLRITAGEYFKDLDGSGYYNHGSDSLVIDANDNGTWDAIGYIPSTVYITGGAGQATVDYTASTEATTVYITVSVDPASGITGFAETSIQLTPNAEIGSIGLATEDIHLAVKRTGGLETSTIYATGYDAYGNRVPEGVPVSFIITDGPDDTDDGERLGTLAGVDRRGPYTTATNSMGIASCPISSGTVSGTIRIRAYKDTVYSEATQIMVHAGPPANIVVAAKECNVPFWGWVNREQDIVAIVSDVYHNPVQDSTIVYFTCDEGTVAAHMERTQDEMGLVETKWLSGYEDVTADGIVWIFAETNGGTLVDSGYFINSWIPYTIEFVTDPMSGLEPFPGHINADGTSSKFFYIEVRDVNDNYVDANTEIDLESDILNVASGFVEDGCNASRVRTFMMSVILEYDHSMNGSQDDGIGAVDIISANYSSIVNSAMPCTLLTGPAYSRECRVEVPASVNEGMSVPFTVTIKDRWGNPLGDHALVATVTGGGSITNANQSSDMYGEAVGFTYNAPAPGSGVTSVIISIEDTDALGGITFNEVVTINSD